MYSIKETLSHGNVKDSSNINVWLLGSKAKWPESSLGKRPVWLSIPESGKNSINTISLNEKQIFILQIAEGSDYQIIEKIRKLGAELIALASKAKITKLAISDIGLKKSEILAFVEGAVLASYQFEKYKSKPSNEKNEFKLLSSEVSKNDLNALISIVDAVALTRNLVNEPASHLTAKKLSEAFVKTGKSSGFEVEVLDKSKIKTLKMGGLLGVNQGSDLPPTFNILEYKGKNAKNKKPIVLVGKGVVYDTGGHSLKTSAGMEYMKCDMAGSATVLGVFKAVAELELPIHLIGLVPATDNRISAAAISPGDVITISDGTTVEVMNTDAEGRLILADALVFAKKYDPQLVIDFATLTGAAARAIGKDGFVFMGTASKEIKETLHLAGEQVYERGVEFPLWDEYAEYIKSDVADIKNIGGAEAGAITAGKFLQHFTNYPWMHLDIAGTSFYEGGAVGYISKGGTGIGVRLMVEFLQLLIK